MFRSKRTTFLFLICLLVVTPLVAVDEGALAILKQIRSLDADSPEVPRLCHQFLERVPGHAGIWNRLMESEFQQGRPALGEEVKRLRARILGNDVSTPRFAVSEFKKSKVGVGKIFQAKVSVERGPGIARMWYQLADAYQTGGEGSIARLIALHGGLDRQESPEHSRIWEYLGLLKEKMGSRTLTSETVRLLPPQRLKRAADLERTIQFLLEHGDPMETPRYLAVLEQLGGESGAYWLLAGNAWYRIGDWAQAERAYSRSLSRVSNPVDAWQGLARLSARQKDLNQTVVWLKKLQGSVGEEQFLEFLMDPAFEKLPQVLQYLD